MSVENVPAVLNIRTLKGQFIAHKFSTGWAVEVVKSGKEEECCWPAKVAVKYKSETYCWTQKLSREDYGVHKYFLLL